MKEVCLHYSYLSVNLCVPSLSDLRGNSPAPFAASADWGAPVLVGGERFPSQTWRSKRFLKKNCQPAQKVLGGSHQAPLPCVYRAVG